MKNHHMEKMPWYCDYIRTTDDTHFILSHFLKDFFFQHRLRYIIYLRICQNTANKILRLILQYKLYKLGRKYGIEIKSATQIGPGFVMTHPYNITISPYATIGSNVNILKGATLGISGGKHPGAPKIGNSVYIGINSTIIGGIHIGDDVLIAPNTLVNQDVPDHSVVIGNPCKIIHKDNATQEYISYKI